MQRKQLRKILKINLLIIKLESPESTKYGMSHILVNTLYYCERKNNSRVFYLVPRAAFSC